MVKATGTTTLGFIVWTVALSAIGWIASVAAKWYALRKTSTSQPFSQTLRGSILAGEFLAVGMIGLVLISCAVFLVLTVYNDHQSLVNATNLLFKKRTDLAKELEIRKHSMVTTDPVFPNTIYLLEAFNTYRHAQNGRPCVILLSEPTGGGSMASMVGQFSNSVSGCFTFGPMDSRIDPDVEEQATNGMIPGMIVLHAARDDKAADQLLIHLGNQIQVKRSFDLPSAIERRPMYSIPTPGRETLIWLQFGPDVKWNEQVH